MIDTTRCGRTRIQDAPEDMQIALIFMYLSPDDRNKWITSAVMGLDPAAAQLWKPSKSYDDAHKVLRRLLDVRMGKRFVKALRRCTHMLGERTDYKNEDTDTFSLAQAVDILSASPDQLCLASLYTIASDAQARRALIEAFAPAAALYSGPIGGQAANGFQGHT